MLGRRRGAGLLTPSAVLPDRSNQAMTHPYASPIAEEVARQRPAQAAIGRVGSRRALLAAALSALLPGVGHLYLGRSRRGLAMLAISAAVIAVAVRIWLLGEIFW